MPRKVKGNNIVKAHVDSYQPMLSPVEWAYVAGIVDGEGSVTILRAKKKRPPRVYYILTPRVYLSNTNLALINWLQNKLGLKLRYRARPELKERQNLKRIPQVCYYVELNGYRCHNLLKGVLPYLIVKKAQAEAVIQYIESRIASSGRAYNPGYSEIEKALWLKVRALNRGESAPYDAVASLTP